MSDKITDAQQIKTMILAGVATCPDNVDANIFNLMLSVVNAEKGSVQTQAQDVPWEDVTPTKNAMTVSDAVSTAVATPMNGVEFGLDDFESSVSSSSFPWIGMSNGIVRVGKDTINAGNGIKAKLIGANTRFAKGIRITNPANPQDYVYKKTYNGNVTPDGENWNQIVERAKAVNPNTYVYNLVELELELEDDLMSGKKVALEKGSHVKFANSPSAAKLMKELSDACKKVGQSISTDDIEVMIAPTIMTKKDGSTYQVLNVTKR